MEPGSVIYCGRCGNECQVGTRYCPRCGELLPTPDNLLVASPPTNAPYPPPTSQYPPAGDLYPPPEPHPSQAPYPYDTPPAPPPYGAPPQYSMVQPNYYGQPYAQPPPGTLPAPPYSGMPAYGPRRFIESVYRPDQLVTASAGRRLGAYALDVLLMIVTLVIGWFVWFCFSAPKGQTPAKQILNMYVMRADGTRAGGWYMWLREFVIKGLLFSIVNVIILGIGWLISAAWCLWDNDRQCLWDKVGGTYVAYSPNRFTPATAKELRQAASWPPPTYLP